MSWPAKYIGKRFKAHGRGPDEYDCWGLVRDVLYREFGKTVPGYNDAYAGIFDANVFRLFESESKKWKSITNEQPGDVLLFRVRTRPWHVGIVTDRIGWMLHVTKGIDVSVERYNSPLWRPKKIGFYRYA